MEQSDYFECMKITVYTTSTCPNCVKLKDYLKNKSVDFAEVNLHENPDKMGELQSIAPGTSSVPVLVFYEDENTEPQILHGFDEDKIEELLKLT